MEACEEMETGKVNRYGLAAWFSFASAVLSIPLAGLQIYLMVLSGDHPGAGFLNSGVKFFNVMLTATTVPITVFVLYMLRRLLNDRFDFHRTDKLITTMIWATIVTFPIQIAAHFMDADTSRRLWLIALASVPVLIIFQCVITILFARRLLNMAGDLYGLKRPFARWTIVSVICQATIILMPVGILAALATQIMLGVVFLRAKDDEEFL